MTTRRHEGDAFEGPTQKTQKLMTIIEKAGLVAEKFEDLNDMECFKNATNDKRIKYTLTCRYQHYFACAGTETVDIFFSIERTVKGPRNKINGRYDGIPTSSLIPVCFYDVKLTSQRVAGVLHTNRVDIKVPSLSCKVNFGGRNMAKLLMNCAIYALATIDVTHKIIACAQATQKIMRPYEKYMEVDEDRHEDSSWDEASDGGESIRSIDYELKYEDSKQIREIAMKNIEIALTESTNGQTHFQMLSPLPSPYLLFLEK